MDVPIKNGKQKNCCKKEKTNQRQKGNAASFLFVELCGQNARKQEQKGEHRQRSEDERIAEEKQFRLQQNTGDDARSEKNERYPDGVSAGAARPFQRWQPKPGIAGHFLPQSTILSEIQHTADETDRNAERCQENRSRVNLFQKEDEVDHSRSVNEKRQLTRGN